MPMHNLPSPISILIIDTAKKDRVLCATLLEKIWGDKVWLSEAANGEGGLQSLGEELPHCVLLADSLPDHNGITLLKQIRLIHPHLPVILLSEQNSMALAVQSMREGAQDCLLKSSLTSEPLQRAVTAAIEQCAAQKKMGLYQITQ